MYLGLHNEKIEASFPELVLHGTSRLRPCLKAYYGKLPTHCYHYGHWYNMTSKEWSSIGPMQPDGTHMNCAMSRFTTTASCTGGELFAKYIADNSLHSYATSFML